MAKQNQTTSRINPGHFTGNLNKDTKRFNKSAGEWTQARNVVTNTIVGDLGDISNEMSNLLITSAPYIIIGGIHVGEDNWVIFSTDNTDSEIGLFKEDDGIYTKLVNDKGLNFNTYNLIKGVGRTNAKCGRTIYWDDGRNVTRILDIDNIPWIQECTTVDSCQICTDTSVLDLDKIRLAPHIKDLAFKINRGNSSGQIINGSYYVVGAYLIEGVRITDYSLPSNVQPLFTHDNMASSLEITVTEADQSFDEYELIIVQFANFNTVATKVGVYSTRQTNITLDKIDERWEKIDPSLILLNNPIAEKSDAVYRNGEYMLRVGPHNKFDFNYQPLANQIEANWVVVEYDADYYKNGGSNVGNMRDEVYPYFIRWRYATGDKSNSFHIPGRIADAIDTELITNDDVIEGGSLERWKVYNTAIVNPLYPRIGQTLEGGTILGGGKMAYWESSEKYDDDKPEVWNLSSNDKYPGVRKAAYDLCGKPIRHHKFPDNDTDTSIAMITNHYNPGDSSNVKDTTAGTKIRILGVEFTNIKPPLDNQGKPIDGIVGYEILRGSRDGNKTVLAKGIVNNMRQYVTTDADEEKTFLYPNYPYNPTNTFTVPNPSNTNEFIKVKADRFLSSIPTEYEKNSKIGPYGENQFGAYLRSNTDLPLGVDFTQFQPSARLDGNIRKDLLTFHSPETNFRNPFLSAKEIKIYGEMQGRMTGRFEIPKDHPRHKFITNTAFTLSAILGLGFAAVSMQGESKHTHHAPQIDYGGTKTDLGTSSGTTGMFGPSALASGVMSGANATATAVNQLLHSKFNTSTFGIGLMALGIDPQVIVQIGQSTAGAIAGAIGGTGSKEEYQSSNSPWNSTPGVLRSLTGIPAFLSFYAEGINKMLDLIYAFTPYRNYALQQISHGFYNSFAAGDEGNRRRAINTQAYLGPNLQDFTSEFRINNIYRARTVALELDAPLDLPYKRLDDSQALFSDVWGRTPAHDLKWSDPDYLNSSFKRNISSHYVALKQQLDNQYGQLQSIMQIPISTDYTDITETTSPILFGGDTYIGRYTEKNTMFFFYDWLYKQPDGMTWNYKLHKMLPHPRFWMDTDPFDVGEFMNSLSSLFGSNSAPPSFDPYIINPELTREFNVVYSATGPTVQIPNPNYKPNAVCNCETEDKTDCYFPKKYLRTLCDEANNVTYWQNRVDFLEACACKVHNRLEFEGDEDECEACNDTNSPNIEDFLDDGIYGQPDCVTCPPWSSKDGAKYTCKDKGKAKRAINRANRSLKKAQKKYNKALEELYDYYMDSLTSGDSGDGSWIDAFKNLKTPNDKFAFDMKDSSGFFRLGVKNAFMYLFNSGIRDFFVESEVNIDFRDWGNTVDERHYDHTEYTNLKEIFGTDVIRTGNYMKYDYSLSVNKLFNNFVSWGSMQSRDYNPITAETCYLYQPKRVLYSLPQQLENKKDNWRVFLPLNYKDFRSVTTSIKPISNNGAIFLFENESPIQALGVENMELDGGTKITIGDGSLFSQPLQNVVNAEYPTEYGSCQNRLAVLNTPMGLYYMSQNQGKIFKFSGQGLIEISNDGLKWWFSKYLPYVLTQHPTAFLLSLGEVIDFELKDNPVTGIGCQVIYDSLNQVVFFCKKDWQIKEDMADTITYISGDNFLVNNKLKVKLGDPRYFNPASWTASWDPKAKGGQGAWVSFHDWHPDLTLSTKHTFMTTKLNGMWKHANRCDSFCNFYGVDYPFEIEYALHTIEEVNTLRNVMYLMEAYVYANNCMDRHHMLDANFDEAVIYNSEQCSGLLRLNLYPKNDPAKANTYPIVKISQIDILYTKEEQKYRFNQFWDITKDRGEFTTSAEQVIWNTEANGYNRNLNPYNLDYNKDSFEHKKFRHYKHNVLLKKNISGNTNFILTLGMQSTLHSSR